MAIKSWRSSILLVFHTARATESWYIISLQHCHSMQIRLKRHEFVLRHVFYSMWWWFDAMFGVIKVLSRILFITRNVWKFLYMAHNLSLHRLVLSIFTLIWILVLNIKTKQIHCISLKTQQGITYCKSIFDIWCHDYKFGKHWICNVYLNNKIS